jgi:hypothetical protein
VTLHLGRNPSAPDSRDLKIEDYVDLTAKIHVPWNLGHEDKMPQPRLMLGNGPDDSVAPDFQGASDCVFAFIINAIRLACGVGGKKIPPFTGKEAIAAYSEVTGYKLNDESTDNGTDMRTALNWWRNTGIADAVGTRHKLGAYAVIPKGGHLAWFQALWQLDVGVGLGINFPSSAMDQFNAGQVWQVVPGSPIDGGHAILLDARRQWPKVETWARDQDVSEPFLETEVEEAYALFMPEMLNSENESPEGLNIAKLKADLAAVSS